MKTNGATMNRDETQDRIRELEGQLAAERKRAEEEHEARLERDERILKFTDRVASLIADRDSLRAQLEEARKKREDDIDALCAEMHGIATAAGIPMTVPIGGAAHEVLSATDRLHLMGRALTESQRALAASQARLAEATKWTDEDQPIPEDEAISAAHPATSDDPAAHKRYAEALRMVEAKRSKYALVDLVNWLLARLAEVLLARLAEVEAARIRETREAQDCVHQLEGEARLALAESQRALAASQAREGAMRGALREALKGWAKAANAGGGMGTTDFATFQRCHEPLDVAPESQSAAPGSREEAAVMRLAESEVCVRCHHSSHLGLCTARMGGTGYACKCSHQAALVSAAPSVSPAAPGETNPDYSLEDAVFDIGSHRPSVSPAAERREATSPRCPRAGHWPSTHYDTNAGLCFCGEPLVDLAPPSEEKRDGGERP